MSDFIQIKSLYFDATSEDFPRVWTAVGTLKRANKRDTPRVLKVRLSIGPPAEWGPEDKEPTTAYGWSGIERAVELDQTEFLQTRTENDDETLWIANFFPEKDSDTVWFYQRLKDNQNSDEAGPQSDAPDRVSSIVVCVLGSGDPKARPEKDTPKAFSYDEITPRKPWNVGVLLVHGISSYKKNKVLVDFGEPIVKFIERWADGYNEWSAQRYSITSYRAIVNAAHEGALRTRSSLLGFTEVFERYEPLAGASSDVKETNTRSMKETSASPFLLNVQALDTQADGEFSGTALIKISSLSEDGVLNEAFLAFKEVIWSDHALVPNQSDMMHWIWKCYPVTISNYFNKRIFRPLWKPKLLSLISRILIVLFSPIYLVFSFLMILLLQLLAAVAAIPIAPLQKLVGRLFLMLLDTVGQSYAFVESAMRRAAISAPVSKELNWLEDHCESISVISHSQGAAVTNEVFRARTWPNVQNWNVLGSGLQVLAVLRDRRNFKGARRSLLWIAVLSAAFVLASAQLFVAPLSVSSIGLAAASYSALFATAMWMAATELEDGVLKNTRATTIQNAKEYHSTHDPVSIGYVLNPIAKANIREAITKINNRWDPKDPDKLDPIDADSHQVFNSYSNLRDHTSYFENTEEVVSRIAFDILKLAQRNTGLPDFRRLRRSKDMERLRIARVNRPIFVMMLGINRFVLLLIVLVAFFTSFLPVWQLSWQAHVCVSGNTTECTGRLAAIWSTMKSPEVAASLLAFLVVLLHRIYVSVMLSMNANGLFEFAKPLKERKTMFGWVDLMFVIAFVLAVYLWMTKPTRVLDWGAHSWEALNGLAKFG